MRPFLSLHLARSVSRTDRPVERASKPNVRGLIRMMAPEVNYRPENSLCASFGDLKSLVARAVSAMPPLIAILDKHSPEKEKAAIYFSIFRNSCGCEECEAVFVKFYTPL